ncbi:hypothetical protein VTI74DRAFT_8308 [Chaetomium olivicolor]
MEHPHVKREPGEPPSTMSSPVIKQEPEESPYDLFKLPLRPRSTPTDRDGKELGEVTPSPPFPRALYMVSGSSDQSIPNRHPVVSVEQAIRRMPPGPNPNAGTPQDRLRQLVEGRGYQGNRDLLGRRRSNSRGGAPPVPPPVPVGPRVTWPGGPATPVGPQTSITQGTAGPWGPGSGGPPSMGLATPSNPVVPSGAANSQARPHPPGPAELLSKECQMRGFNPVWQPQQWSTDKYSCSVTLLEHLVTTNVYFHTAGAAKTAVAQKALGIIRTWPKPFRVSHRNRERSQAQRMGMNTQHPQVPTAPNGPKPQDIKQEEDTAMVDIGAIKLQPNAISRTRSQSQSQAREHADLLQRVCQVVGISLPNPDDNSVEMTRAFLQGLAAGARLAGSAPRRRRTRSCSPSDPPHAPDNRRERSPTRRRRRVPRAHRTTDRYMPGHGQDERCAENSHSSEANSRTSEVSNWVHDKFFP